MQNYVEDKFYFMRKKKSETLKLDTLQFQIFQIFDSMDGVIH